MLGPNYRLSEATEALVWGAFGALLLGGALHDEFNPVPALAGVAAPLLALSGGLLVLAALTNLAVGLPFKFESTRWKILLVSDMARICGLCVTAYASLSAAPVAEGWAVLGVGLSLAAGARMWVLWVFLREIHKQRHAARRDGV